jgi:hypothetical protein
LCFLETAAAVELGANAWCFLLDCALGFGFGRPVVDGEVVRGVDYTAAKCDDLAFVVVLHAAAWTLGFFAGRL